MKSDTKSHLGAPTTNIVPNPTINADFTVDNQWGSYNTNQYNSNSYFTIPSISSVSGNLVTTSSAHPFRTYDVCTPQTTGGGVTAGSNYFIRKWTDTTFSIHSYNNNQSGAFGYLVNDSYHKVHESVALDQRVSINATSFPTSWWGPPHLPNSAVVKEIVNGGGRRSGSNSMRMHVTRTAGVGSDGMAYNVYCPVTSGDTVRVSFWYKLTRGTVGASVSWQTYFGPSFGAPSSNFTPTREWQRFEFTWTASNTFNFYQYWFPSGNGIGAWAFDICDLHVTKNESSFANFYPGARTEVLKDWTNRSGTTFTTTDPVYSTSEYNNFSYNGSTSRSYSLSAAGLPSGSGNKTIIAWIKPTASQVASTSYIGIVAYGLRGDSTPSSAILLSITNTSGTTHYVSSAYWNNDYVPDTNVVDNDQWNMIGMVARGAATTNNTTLFRFSSSGESITTGTSSSYTKGLNTQAQQITVGCTDQPTGRNFSGEIGQVLIYDGELTTNQIREIYNQTKGNYL